MQGNSYPNNSTNILFVLLFTHSLFVLALDQVGSATRASFWQRFCALFSKETACHSSIGHLFVIKTPTIAPANPVRVKHKPQTA